MAGAIAQDWESCQFPFVVDEKPNLGPGGSCEEIKGQTFTSRLSCFLLVHAAQALLIQLHNFFLVSGVPSRSLAQAICGWTRPIR